MLSKNQKQGVLMLVKNWLGPLSIMMLIKNDCTLYFFVLLLFLVGIFSIYISEIFLILRIFQTLGGLKIFLFFLKNFLV